jgi:integrase
VAALAEGLGWDTQIHLISEEDVRDFRDDGAAVLSPATVRSYMAVLRRFFAFLMNEGWIRRNPSARVKLPASSPRREHLTRIEAARFLASAWELLPDLAPIATTLVLGGLRKGEVINLRRELVDLESRWATITEFRGDENTTSWRPKTNSSYRKVPLHPIVVEALRRSPVVELADGKPSPWVFPVLDERKVERVVDARGRTQLARGDRRSPSTTFFGKKLRPVLRSSGIERDVNIHDLRRTFAVLLQETGAPDSIIRQALGHGGQGVTELHYLPRRDAEVQRWVDRIEFDLELP